MREIVAAVGAVGVVVAVMSSLAGASEFVAPLMARAPRLDGRVDQGEWRAAVGFDGFQHKGSLQRRRVRGYVGATTDAIYVAIVSQLPARGDLRATIDRDTLKAVFDDSLEVYVDPTPGEQKHVVYQFLVNSKGKGGYKVHTFGGAEESVAWSGGWEQAHGMHDGWWHFECAVPLSSMSAAGGRKATDGTWGVNLTRNWKSPWEWSSITGGYAEPLPVIRFVSSGSAAVQYAASADPFLTNFKGTVSLYNPSSRRQDLRVAMVLGRNRMPTLRSEERVSVPARGTKAVTLDVPQDDATTKFDLSVDVTSADGTAVYRHKIAWPKGKPYEWIAGEKKKVAPVDFRFAYYPYRNRCRILADISGLGSTSGVTRVVAVVREAKTGRGVKTVYFPVEGFEDGRQEKTFDLRPLDGSYEIALKAEGSGVPSGEMVKSFERTRYEWENTSLGTSTKVYPPFTPIATRGRRLSTVLRDHLLNGYGLWDQVTATSANTGVSKSMLASPMRYVARVGGREVDLRPKRLVFTSRREHEVKARGGFSGDAIDGSCETTWDYDGTVRVDLELAPTGGRAIDELTLEIPFYGSAATYLHANADRIRAPVAIRLPQRDGVLWDASKLACDDYIKNFCPYVYVGTPARGVCWFAENDRGWGWDPKTPNVDVARSGGEVVLRVHLVNTPTVVSEKRTITFGMLAAPVKPPLSPGGKHWWRYRYLRDRYTLLGTDINWLSMGTCGSVYPAGKDPYFWEMIARGNKERLPADVVNAVVERGNPLFKPYGAGKLDSWKRHVHHNLRSRYGSKMVFYYNRASHQAADEFQTFEDEWSLNDWRSVGKGRGLGEIKIVPSKSYIDHALYWYRKSFEVGNNQGVYWDNWFIAPTFNTEMTDAYVRDDGTIVPAAGIWGLRELCKRTFVMLNELGKPPITFPHMTSFNPLPMMAFATVQYDWEWKYSMGDVQDRHTRELILMTGTGELAGVWPVPLHDHGKLGRDPWTQRTFAAVRLVHELDGGGGFGLKETRALADHFLKMLDEPKLEVYRYWEDRAQPVITSDPDVHTIVYSVPGRVALVGVVGFAPADRDVTLYVDAKALGLDRGLSAVNAETGAEMRASGTEIRFRLKKHDIRVLRLTTGGGR